MREFLIATKFVWEYATHLQTDSNPPLELIFKFVDTLDKKSTRQHIRNFDKLAISKDIYKHKLPLRLRIKEEQFKKAVNFEKNRQLTMYSTLYYKRIYNKTIN